jgi:hypothetical protein
MLLGLYPLACTAPMGPVLIDGQPVPRQQLEFSGQPYAIHHYDAYPRPGRPSGGLKAEGGRITGVVCGAAIEFHVNHAGDRVSVSGFTDNEYQTELEIADSNGYTTIIGNLAYREVRLNLFANRLEGVIGRCSYNLRQDGDALVQDFRASSYPMHLQINGLDALWQMPPADQAAILPLVLQCLSKKRNENWAHSQPPQMGFGGKETSVPMDTLTFVASRVGFCQPVSPHSSGVTQ